VSIQDLSLTAIQNLIYDNQRPTYIRGASSGGNHAWVIDGINFYNIRDWLVKYAPPKDLNSSQRGEEISRELLSSTPVRKVHCNMGWGGLCDGYYTYNVFDTSKRLNFGDVDTSVGDKSGTVGYIFNSAFKIIYYTLP